MPKHYRTQYNEIFVKFFLDVRTQCSGKMLIARTRDFKISRSQDAESTPIK